MTLFEIGDEIRALHDLLTECGGELADAEAEAAIDEWLAETNVSLERKLNGTGWAIRDFEAKAEAREIEAKRLIALAATDRNQAKRLKDRVKRFLEIHGLTKVETEHFKFTVAKSGGLASLIFPEEWERDPASAPERYHVRTVTLGKKLLREDAEATELELARLSSSFAAGEITAAEYNDALHVAEFTNVVRLGERDNHLRIR